MREKNGKTYRTLQRVILLIDVIFSAGIESAHGPLCLVVYVWISVEIAIFRGRMLVAAIFRQGGLRHPRDGAGGVRMCM